MALLGMAIFSTIENKKDTYLRKTLDSLRKTVDFSKHTLGVSINGFTDETYKIIEDFEDIIYMVVNNEENIGTAKAINKIWVHRKPEQHLIKLDDDVLIHQAGWIEELEECINRNNRIGIIGLKRKDCWENPNHENPFYRSVLKTLEGQPPIIIEQVHHVMGTCQMYNYRLIDIIGGLYQMGALYGLDDSLAAFRSQLAGFINCFMPHVEIDHIDPGDTPYQKWKESHAGAMFGKFNELKQKMLAGEISIKYEL